MKIQDQLQEAYSALSGNKARSGLTMLGIVIGICSVIVLVGIGQGATASVTSSISSLGSNLLTVSPGSYQSGGVSSGAGGAATLTEDDAEAIEAEVPGVAAVSTELSGRYQITYKSNNTNAQIVGTDPEYTEVRSVNIASGTFFSNQQVKSYSKVAVIGPDIQDELFGENVDPVGQTIKINKIQFKVIGVTESKGGTGMNNSDNSIYIPISSAQRFLAGSTSISSIYIQAQDEDSIDVVKEGTNNLLLTRHNITDSSSADFSITSQEDIVSSLSSVSNTLSLLLGAIAGISLLVGGIGIMNMMLTTVTERTREIGLRKAVGAKKGDISSQFLTESVLLTFLGGTIGVVLGWIIAFILNSLNVVTVAITWQSVVLAFGVSAFVGIVFGYYPSRRAANLNPIEALKYE